MGSASSKWLAQLDLSQPVDAATTERIFNEYDKDRNGFLDGSEAKLFVEEWCKHYGVKDPCHVVKCFFDTFDADGDGKITKAELIGPMGPPRTTRERSRPVMGQAPMVQTPGAAPVMPQAPGTPRHGRMPSTPLITPFVVPPRESLDLRDLEAKFRRCAITKDRHFHLKKYPDCFAGNETVELLVTQGYAKTRTEAVFYGNFLMENGLFVNVSREQPFKDEGLFYQFANRQTTTQGPTMAEVRAIEALHERYLANKDDDDDVIIVEL
jgi:hypothetical protein